MYSYANQSQQDSFSYLKIGLSALSAVTAAASNVALAVAIHSNFKLLEENSLLLGVACGTLLLDIALQKLCCGCSSDNDPALPKSDEAILALLSSRSLPEPESKCLGYTKKMAKDIIAGTSGRAIS